MQFLTSRVVFPLSSSMLRRALLTCPIVAVLLLVRVYAEQSEPSANARVHAPQKDGAERVFATAASKVVFLMTRKSGELHARASGIILTADGYIATNYHALQGGDAVEIRFFPNPEDSATYQSFNEAELLYADAVRDIAILKVSSKVLPFLECSARTDGKPRIGESVYAIGNPRGLTNTISEGIVSSLRVDAGERIIQHTAAISPGSSGGALVDSNGDLVGMNSWQVADAQNLNFAISAEDLLNALGVARKATKDLSFPPDTLAETISSPEDNSRRISAGQDGLPKDKAVSQMRQIVDAIRRCPGTEVQHWPEVTIQYRSPRILEWDVLASNSLRAPFQGYVRFDQPFDLQETDEAKRSKKLHRKYEFLDQTLRPAEYRYEFDLGADVPQLRRALFNLHVSSFVTDFKLYEPSLNGFCWDQIATSPGSALRVQD